jgi:hypothetical protein
MSDTFKNFSDAQLKAALAKPWSSAAAKEIAAEIERRKSPPIKKNPILKYFLCIRKTDKSPVMTWDGDRFTNSSENFKPFSRADTAQRMGKKLIKQFPILKGYKMWVSSSFHTAPVFGKKQRAMRGGTKSNPSKRSRDAELDEASKKLEDFTGHPVAHLESAYSRSSQKTGLIIGELDLVGYRAKRDGKLERYGHHFKKNSRPLLAVTSDGKQLHIVGGQYEFTEAGIEDR